jgi:DNA-directed RNA polymerase specialized sigma24 family protein
VTGRKKKETMRPLNMHSNEPVTFCHHFVINLLAKIWIVVRINNEDRRNESVPLNKTPKRYQEIDWSRVMKVLQVYAEALTRSASIVFDCGVSSAEDLVSETIQAYLDSPKGLGWRPKDGSLEAFLCGVLNHKFKDHCRRQQKVAGSLDDENYALPAEKGSKKDDGFKVIEYSEFIALALSQVAGDKDLEDYIVATELIDGAHNVNQQLADAMGISVAEVGNRKKKLLRIKGIRELYEQR